MRHPARFVFPTFGGPPRHLEWRGRSPVPFFQRACRIRSSRGIQDVDAARLAIPLCAPSDDRSLALLTLIFSATLLFVTVLDACCRGAGIRADYDESRTPRGGVQDKPNRYAIAVSVASSTEVLSVTAGQRRPQRGSGLQQWGWGHWTGSLSLTTGCRAGPYTMVIEASNAGGQTAQVSRGLHLRQAADIESRPAPERHDRAARHSGQRLSASTTVRVAR